MSVLGERYTHSHIFDFYKQLRDDPSQLRVLGDGRQRKSYIYVQDCIDAMLLAIGTLEEPVNIRNLGTDEYVEVNESIRCIVGYLGLAPVLHYTGDKRGWVGDSPFIILDMRRFRALGWRPWLSICAILARTVQYLMSFADRDR